MEARSTRARWTYAEFARLPSEGSTRHEIIANELFVTPAPGLRHQRIVMALILRLGTFAREHACGEVFVAPFDVLFGEGDYVEPDVLFVRQDHAHLLSDRGVEGPPDLVVEVVSPSTAARDRGLKRERYFHFGVPEYWVVDPDARTVEVWTEGNLEGAPRVLGVTDTLRWTPLPPSPTLEIDVGDLFGGDRG